MTGDDRSGAAKLTRYLVELEQPADGWGELRQVTARARAAAEQLRAKRVTVWFLRSIFVPKDESCLFVYEAGSIEAVREAARLARLPVQRAEESVQISEQEESVP